MNGRVGCLSLLWQYEEVKGGIVGVSRRDKNNAKYSCMYTVPILGLLRQYKEVIPSPSLSLQWSSLCPSPCLSVIVASVSVSFMILSPSLSLSSSLRQSLCQSLIIASVSVYLLPLIDLPLETIFHYIVKQNINNRKDNNNNNTFNPSLLSHTLLSYYTVISLVVVRVRDSVYSFCDMCCGQR